MFQTRDQYQDKASKKLDRVLYKKKKFTPLSDESWSDLTQRGASLAEQEEWIKLKRKKLDKDINANNQ